jgi:hypothetical protein
VKAAAVLHVAPNELGPLREGEDAHERSNRWMLASALGFKSEKVEFCGIAREVMVQEEHVT